jgi:hypothetical protein
MPQGRKICDHKYNDFWDFHAFFSLPLIRIIKQSLRQAECARCWLWQLGRAPGQHSDAGTNLPLIWLSHLLFLGCFFFWQMREEWGGVQNPRPFQL